MRRDRLPVLILIALLAVAGGPMTARAQVPPAVYVPGIGLPELKGQPAAPQSPKSEPSTPQTWEKPSAKREVTGRGRALSGDTLRIEMVTFHLWGIIAPAMNEFGGYTAMQGLSALIQGHSVFCEPTGTYFRAVPMAHCRVEMRDLAEDAVLRGLARDCAAVSNGTFAPFERRVVTDVAGGIILPDDCRSLN